MRIYKGILASPDSFGKEFRAVAGSAIGFFQQVCKNNYNETWSGKKVFLKEKKHSSGIFLRKAIVLKRIYTVLSSFENTFSTLFCKPKQNTKDQDKLKLNTKVCYKNISAVL